MAKAKANTAGLKIYGTDAPQGKKTPIGKVRINSMSLESAAEFIADQLSNAKADGASVVRGTITVYKQGE
jgi:hypothetical protein